MLNYLPPKIKRDIEILKTGGQTHAKANHVYSFVKFRDGETPQSRTSGKELLSGKNAHRTPGYDVSTNYRNRNLHLFRCRGGAEVTEESVN